MDRSFAARVAVAVLCCLALVVAPSSEAPAKKKGGAAKKAEPPPPPAAPAAATAPGDDAESLDKEVAAAESSMGYGRWHDNAGLKEIGDEYEFPPVKYTPKPGKLAVPAPGPQSGGD